MFLVREEGDRNDITLLNNKSELMLHLHARLLLGTDVENRIDVFPVHEGGRIHVTNAELFEGDF